MRRFKRVNISIDESLLLVMKETAHDMGMTLSSWIKFIAIDKIASFEKHAVNKNNSKTTNL